MIFDFNVPYKINPERPHAVKPASFKLRAGFAWTYLIDLPSRIVKTIMEIAKVLFFSICAAFCFGQARFMNESVRLAAHKAVYNACQANLDLVGFFAPLNATMWKMHVFTHHMKNIDNISKKQKPSAVFEGLSQLNLV